MSFIQTLSFVITLALLVPSQGRAELRITSMKVDQEHQVGISSSPDGGPPAPPQSRGVPSTAAFPLSQSYARPNGVGLESIRGINTLITTLPLDGLSISVNGFLRSERSNLITGGSHTHYASSTLVLTVEVVNNAESFSFDEPTITETLTRNSVPMPITVLYGPYRVHTSNLGTVGASSPISLPVGTHTLYFEMFLQRNSFGETGVVDDWMKSINTVFHFSSLVLMPGTTQANPVLGTPRPGNAWAFNTPLPSGFYDPPMAQGYTFTAEGGTLFKRVISFPSGLGESFWVKAGSTNLGSFSKDQNVNFELLLGNGVSTFEVRGIQPFVDATSPRAFPIMLEFNATPATFTMAPIAAPDLKLRTLPTGDLEITFDGVLQSSTDLSPGSWTDVAPPPTSPLVVPKQQLTSWKFFRSREIVSP